MKKMIITLFVILFTLSSSVLSYADYAPEDISGIINTNVSPLYEVTDCKLTVNGKRITNYSEYVKIFYDNDSFVNAQIPLFEVIKALGAKVFWVGENAIVLYKTGIFFYNSELTYMSHMPLFNPLFSENLMLYLSFFNILEEPYAGGKGVYDTYKLDKEVIVNDSTTPFLKLDFCFKVEIDIETKTINIVNNPFFKRILSVVE